MKPVFVGSVAAAAIVVAFIAGSFVEIEEDGSVEIKVEEQGPLESLGEEVDEAVDEIEESAQ